MIGELKVMNFLDEILRDFWLHESSVSQIDCEDSQLVFNFNRGFWNDKHEQLEKCKLIVKIQYLEVNSVNSFVSIQKSVVKKNCILSKSISFSQLEKLLQKSEFEVETEYYSEFERAMLIVGRISKYRIDMKITDIDELIFLFE